MKKLIGLILMFGTASFAQATDSFVVNAKLYESETMVLETIVVVNPNEETSSPSIDYSYSFSVNVTPVNDSTVSLDANIKFREEHMSTSLVVLLGEEATVRAGNRGLTVVVNKSEQLTKR